MRYFTLYLENYDDKLESPEACFDIYINKNVTAIIKNLVKFTESLKTPITSFNLFPENSSKALPQS